jgi:hypothetical protein
MGSVIAIWHDARNAQSDANQLAYQKCLTLFRQVPVYAEREDPLSNQ